MKTWNNAAIEELNVAATAQGKKLSTQFDEIRVDQNGNYWAGMASGADSNPSTDGKVIVP